MKLNKNNIPLFDDVPKRKLRKNFRKTKNKRILEKTNGKCIYCGKSLKINSQNRDCKMTKDHWIPKSKGGTNDFDNLVPCCNDCNCKKGDLLPEEFLSKLEN